MRQATEGGHILVSGEIKDTVRFLVIIPKEINADRIQPHRPRELQSMAPILLRYPGVVNLSAADDKRLSIEDKVATFD